jgi:heme-degrading monooxygenase HmoA
VTAGVRVVLRHDCADPAAIEAAYRDVSTRLAGVPGLLGNELLRSVHDPRDYLVVSRWRDLTAFQQWESGVEHRGDTAPLRPFRSAGTGQPFGIYEVLAEY